jgi:hypothetical protein
MNPSKPAMQAKSIATEVYDSFHELFLYEAIEQLILNHERKQSSLSELQ